jgi:hypothetical protein
MTNSRCVDYAGVMYSKKTRLYDWANCENCKRATVLYQAPGDESYTQMDAFLSFTLEDGATPYIEVKQPLREKVKPYYPSDYLNPIIYLPKSQWGYEK